MHKPLLPLARLVVPFLMTWTCVAQCLPVVPPGAAIVGLDTSPRVITEWDPDGAGPLGLHWVFGGAFGLAGNAVARGVALYDPSTDQWSGLGAGIENVRALLPLAGGRMLASSYVETAGIAASCDLWLWDGVQWSAFASFDGQVAALAVLPNGDIAAAGRFANAAGVPCVNIARWDGTNWLPLGTGVTGAVVQGFPFVNTLLVDAAGDLWVGGAFTTAGGVASRNVARWDGAAWFPAGQGLQEGGAILASGSGVRRMIQLPQGDVVAIGNLDNVGGVPLLGAARWDGSAWHAMGNGLGNGIGVAMTLAPNGDLVAVRGGLFILGNDCLLRWDGANWTGLPNLAAYGPRGSLEACFAASTGELLVGGRFGYLSPNTQRADQVAVLPGTQGGAWSPLANASPGGGLAGGKFRLAVAHGETLAVGQPNWAGTNLLSGAAIQAGADWVPLVPSPRLLNAEVTCTLSNGDLVVGGVGGSGFSPWSFGGQTFGPLIRYDGSTWTRLGGLGIQATSSGVLSVRSLLPLADGTLAVGGAFQSIGGVSSASIARWNGSTWLPFGTGISGEVRAMLQLSSGDLVVGGSFFAAGGTLSNNVARWNGSAWSPMGSGIGSWPSAQIDDLFELQNGDILATNSGSTSLSVVRWDGSAWVDATDGLTVSVLDAVQLPSREVLLAGATQWPAVEPFALMVGDGRSPWRAFAAQPTWSASLGTGEWKLSVTPAGEVLMQGPFREVGGVPSYQVARILPGCPAIANVVGSGCAGSNGQDTLTSEVLPWLGGVARARATGLPNEAIVVVTLGLTSPNVTLGSLSPLALPGCQLLAALDFYVLANVTGGSVPIDLPLPLTPSLVGASLFEQVLSLGLSGGAPFEATSTNALELQLGLFGG